MSRSKFASLFHEVIGESPLAYLQQHRMRLQASIYVKVTTLFNKLPIWWDTRLKQHLAKLLNVHMNYHPNHIAKNF